MSSRETPAIRLSEIHVNGVELPIADAERLEVIIGRVRQADAAEILQRLRSALDPLTFARVMRVLGNGRA